MHHQEVPREPEVIDHAQLPVDLGPRPSHTLSTTGSVPIGGSLGSQPPQQAHLVETVGARIRRQPGSHQPEVEGTPPPQFIGGLHRPRPSVEATSLLSTRTQVGRPGRWEPPVQFLQWSSGPDGSHGGGQASTSRAVVVDIVGDHQADGSLRRQGGQSIVALDI